MATQGERRAETRERLLAAAAELFAERGVEGASVDAIAERAERTSGAVYDHFGGKPGLLFALLEGWTDAVAEVIGAEVAAAVTLDDRLMAIWRNVVVAAQGRRRALDPARARAVVLLHARRRGAGPPGPPLPGGLGGRRRVAPGLGRPAKASRRRRPPRASAVIGVLLGLEMMRRIDPDAIDDHTAVGALRGAVGARRTETRRMSASARRHRPAGRHLGQGRAPRPVRPAPRRGARALAPRGGRHRLLGHHQARRRPHDQPRPRDVLLRARRHVHPHLARGGAGSTCGSRSSTWTRRGTTATASSCRRASRPG